MDIVNCCYFMIWQHLKMYFRIKTKRQSVSWKFVGFQGSENFEIWIIVLCHLIALETLVEAAESAILPFLRSILSSLHFFLRV